MGWFVGFGWVRFLFGFFLWWWWSVFVFVCFWFFFPGNIKKTPKRFKSLSFPCYYTGMKAKGKTCSEWAFLLSWAQSAECQGCHSNTFWWIINLDFLTSRMEELYSKSSSLVYSWVLNLMVHHTIQKALDRLVKRFLPSSWSHSTFFW